MLVEVLVAVLVGVVSLRTWYMYRSGRCTSTRSMVGKTVIITGGTAGIGKEAARDLLRRGARVIIACRNLEKGATVAAELRVCAGGAGEVVVRRLDTSVLSSVRAFAKEILDTEKEIHVLINNAGIAPPLKREVTADGFEMTMATNHLGHFLLTNLLLGRLKESAPSRIINVASLAHKYVMGKFDVNDLGDSDPYDPGQAYCRSKLFNILFARELTDRLKGTNVTANSLNPGFVKTDIFDNTNYKINFVAAIMYIIMQVFGKDAALGAQTTIYLAVSEDVEGVSGRYFSDCKEEILNEFARRKDLATGLWDASVKAVGLQKEETHF